MVIRRGVATLGAALVPIPLFIFVARHPGIMAAVVVARGERAAPAAKARAVVEAVSGRRAGLAGHGLCRAIARGLVAGFRAPRRFRLIVAAVVLAAAVPSVRVIATH